MAFRMQSCHLAHKAAMVILVALVLFMVACTMQEEAKTQQAPQATVADQAAKAFVPPADGAIKPEQAKLFVTASSALLLLAQQWNDRLEAVQGQERIQIIDGFTKARDQVCRKVGLSGMDEFNWISQNAQANPANKKILQDAGLVF